VFLFATALFLTPAIISQKSKPTADLKEFYVLRLAVSDASPFWFDYILDVSPTENGVKVREIRIAPVDNECPSGVTVKAVEREITGKSVPNVAGQAELCGLSERYVSSTIDNFKGNAVASIEDTARFVVVAHCGSGQRIFRFPFPEEVEFLKQLRRKAPAVGRIWDLYFRVQERAFGKEEIFYHISPQQDTELQRQGSGLVAELRSGKFDHGFDKPLSTILDGYQGVVREGSRSHVDLLDKENLSVKGYVAPVYPQIARLARIEGKVELEIELDPKTGAVTTVRPVSGHPLLQRTAIAAAKEWKFEANTRTPVRAVLDFSLGCGTQK
jgi:TonB family protein